LRPGVVAGHFHQLRTGGDEDAYKGFMEGYEYVLIPVFGCMGSEN